ncbi:MAG: hypothetical protein ACHQ6U_11870, partial [Thermodesulfobacteriota bacterium]
PQGPDSNLLYQDIVVPVGAQVASSAIVYAMNQAEELGYIIGDGLTLNGSNQQMRVDIMDPTADRFDTGDGSAGEPLSDLARRSEQHLIHDSSLRPLFTSTSPLTLGRR